VINAYTLGLAAEAGALHDGWGTPLGMRPVDGDRVEGL
jgi:hypothetical protein